MTFLFHAHSGLRYLVFLAAVFAVIVLAFAYATRATADRKGARIATAAFLGLLHTQVLLGIVLLVIYVGEGVFYPALIGHVTMMILAAVVAQFGASFGRRQDDARRGYAVQLAGVLLGVALLVGGVLAIRDSVFGIRSAPSPEAAAEVG